MTLKWSKIIFEVIKRDTHKTNNKRVRLVYFFTLLSGDLPTIYKFIDGLLIKKDRIGTENEQCIDDFSLPISKKILQVAKSALIDSLQWY